MGLEVDHEGSIGNRGQSEGISPVDNSVHLVVEERFSRVVVKPDREPVIDLLEVIEAGLADLFPEGEGLGVSIFLAPEPFTRLVGQGRVFLLLFVVPDVERVEGIEVFEVFLLSPALDSDNLFSELGSPVTKMVDANALVAEAGKDPVEGAADDR